MAEMSFLESVELAEGFNDSAISGGSRSASLHSPRISFSNDFALLSDDQSKQQQQIPSSHNPSSSGEFEFTMNPSAAAQAPVRNPPMLSADELFYKGKLLPLHLPPRIRMVQDLSEVLARDHEPGKNPIPGEAGIIGKSPPLGVMRRERSLRSPARPSVIASTLKSSSYPPPGYSSRPSSPPKSSKCVSGSSNNRWRDLFGLKKSISSPKAGPSSSASSSSSSSVPTKILKMIFNRGSSSSSSSSSGNVNPNSSELPEHPEIPSSNEALLPLLRESSSLSDQHEMLHSSSISSSASSNWTASSASSSNASSSSFSVDFPENPEQLASKSDSRSGNSRARGSIPSSQTRTRRSGPQATRYHQKSSPAPPASAQSGKSSGNLQRSGSINRRSSAGAGAGVSSGGRMQLQDHVLIGHGNNKLRSENSWRRSGDHKPIGGSGGSSSASNPSNYSSSVRVTPVLHVPACIGPSLRNVRVHGLKRLFSSSSSGSNAPGKPQTVA